MSNLAEHEAEQAAITALCAAGECDHPECQEETWHRLASEAFDGAVHNDNNDVRAARALMAIWPSYDDESAHQAVADILCDLRHLCDLMGWNFGETDAAGHQMYQLELQAGGIAKNAPLKSAIQRDLM